MIDVETQLAQRAEEFNRSLDGFLPRGESVVVDAMRYSVEAGGKRLRPALVTEVCINFGGTSKKSFPFAAALEMVHTYSLVHDDLPCMDNDDYRRGLLSCHRKFGEAVALLAGDALLTQAFAVLAGADEISTRQRCEGIALLAESAGAGGMIGGQALDMAYESARIDRAQLEEMNQKKTGELIRLACRFGCMAALAGEEQTTAVMKYADALGLLFQVTDDIMDMTGKLQKIGKTVGKDQKSGKNTWVSLLGCDGANRYAKELVSIAVQSIAPYTDIDGFLYRLPEWIANRDY